MATRSILHDALELPEKLGRHEIVAQLGHGGMAHVYLAIQRGPYGSAKLVVIKQLKADTGREREFLEMFVDEARIAMKLSHPNVVSTFDFVADGNDFHLTMEFLDGQSLLQALRKVGREKMPLDLQVWILTQVLAGLGYAHTLRNFDGTPLDIVHRDVTPSNVILTYAGGVKLVDFGIAKVAGAVSVTQSGMMKGKLGYAAPEQCLGKATTASSDLYSVGVMLWEAIAGKRRTAGETPAATFRARIEGSEPAITDVRPDAPPLLVRAVNRALATRPGDRYATALEFQTDLEGYLLTTAHGSYGAQVLSDFLTKHFAEVSEALHRTIDARIAAAGQSPPGESGFGPEPSPNRHSSDRREAQVAPSRPAASPRITPTARPMAQNPSKLPGATRAGLAGIGLMFAIAGAMVWRTESRPPPQPPLPGPRPALVSSPPAHAPRVIRVEEAPRVPELPRPAVARPGPVVGDRSVRHILKAIPKRSTASAGFTARSAARASIASAILQSAAKVPASARQAVPDRSVPATETPEAETSPGMDLPRNVRRAGGSRHIDERDPYSP